MKDHPPYIEKTILISAPALKVWDVLINPDYTRQWGEEFSEGTWVESDWQLASEVVWMTKDGEVGARGVITSCEPGSLLQIGFYDDVNSRPPLPLGEYSESYFLAEKSDATQFSFKAGPLPAQAIISHTLLWSNAVAKIKMLAET